MRQIAKSSQTKWMNKMKEKERERERAERKKINKKCPNGPKGKY